MKVKELLKKVNKKQAFKIINTNENAFITGEEHPNGRDNKHAKVYSIFFNDRDIKNIYIENNILILEV